jgi:hypothetical protein
MLKKDLLSKAFGNVIIVQYISDCIELWRQVDNERPRLPIKMLFQFLANCTFARPFAPNNNIFLLLA